MFTRKKEELFSVSSDSDLSFSEVEKHYILQAVVKINWYIY
jgi:hypothetical protein